MRAEESLRAATVFGDYFTVGGPATGPQWPTLTRLAADTDLLDEQVTTWRRALAARSGVEPATMEVRAGASVWFLGLTARIVSPPFGAALLTAAVPALTGDTVRISPTGELAVAEVPTRDEPPAAGLLEVVRSTVGPLLAATAQRYRVPLQILRGNVASSLAGAATVIAYVRPDLADPARRLLDVLLDDAQLAGTGAVRAGRFRRATCCLFYRLPDAELCGDCVLAAAAG